MKFVIKCACLALLLLMAPLLARAELYAELASGWIHIHTPAAISRPHIADLRLGYSKTQHQFELAFMSSVNNDDINQLEVDVPNSVSALYHFIPQSRSSLKFHYILGASRVEIDSSYPGIPGTSDYFSGVSYGLGFEEHFESIPRLKLSADLMQLYRGDELDIYATTLGIHYEF